MTWAALPTHIWRDPTLTLADKAVLGVLSTYVNAKSGQAWPSTQRIADDLGVSRSTVKRTLDVLEARGLLTVKARANERGQTSSVYRLTMTEEQAQTQGQISAPPGHPRPTPRVTHDPPPGSPVTHEQDQATRSENKNPPYPPQAGGTDRASRQGRRTERERDDRTRGHAAIARLLEGVAGEALGVTDGTATAQALDVLVTRYEASQNARDRNAVTHMEGYMREVLEEPAWRPPGRDEAPAWMLLLGLQAGLHNFGAPADWLAGELARRAPTLRLLRRRATASGPE
jgi:biotin operon repressor